MDNGIFLLDSVCIKWTWKVVTSSERVEHKHLINNIGVIYIINMVFIYVIFLYLA